MNRREKNRILGYYRDPAFPGSFSSARKFRRGLLDNTDITEISEKSLNALLREDLAHELSQIKPQTAKKNQRQIVSHSVGTSAQVNGKRKNP